MRRILATLIMRSVESKHLPVLSHKTVQASRLRGSVFDEQPSPFPLHFNLRCCMKHSRAWGTRAGFRNRDFAPLASAIAAIGRSSA